LLRYLLVYDDDVLGRIEAVDVLARRPGDQAALNALILSTRNDKFWAVRARAVDAVGAVGKRREPGHDCTDARRHPRSRCRDP